MRLIVGVADMQVSTKSEDVIVTHALGSCLGICVYDPRTRVGGILHTMLPSSQTNPDKARTNPNMFVDTGVPNLFRTIYTLGGEKSRLVVKVAGGAAVQGCDCDRFQIGQRNYTMLRKILWKNGVLIKAENVGGSRPRTMGMEVATGRVWLHSDGIDSEL